MNKMFALQIMQISQNMLSFKKKSGENDLI